MINHLIRREGVEGISDCHFFPFTSNLKFQRQLAPHLTRRSLLVTSLSSTISIPGTCLLVGKTETSCDISLVVASPGDVGLWHIIVTSNSCGTTSDWTFPAFPWESLLLEMHKLFMKIKFALVLWNSSDADAAPKVEVVLIRGVSPRHSACHSLSCEVLFAATRQKLDLRQCCKEISWICAASPQEINLYIVHPFPGKYEGEEWRWFEQLRELGGGFPSGLESGFLTGEWVWGPVGVGTCTVTSVGRFEGRPTNRKTVFKWAQTD